MESQLDGLRSEIVDGKSQSDVIASMRRRGLPIIDAIKATRELFGLSLGSAKELVASHFSYKEAAAASAPLQDDVVQVIEGCGET